MRQLLVTLLFALFTPLISAPKHEIRAVWLTTNYGLDWPTTPATSPRSALRQRDELRRRLDFVQANHLNTVFLQVRLRGDVIYPSRIEPFSPVVAGRHNTSPGYDLLRFAIEECHRRGLECHAWLVCMPIGTAEHVRKHGSASLPARYPSLCVLYRGEWYLNPGEPAVKEYLARIAAEVTRNYNIDGIHLDYIRYPDDPTRFPDQASYRRHATPGEGLMGFRTRSINESVYAIYDTVKSIKPWVLVSSSPLGKAKSTPHYSARGWSGVERVYQDAQAWMRQGKHDFVAPMLYYDAHHYYPFLLDWVACSNGRPIVSGVGAYRLDPAEADWHINVLLRQLTFSRQIGASGACYYRLGSLIDNYKNLQGALLNELYPTPAVFPPLPFIDAPAVPAPEQLAYLNDSLSWKPLLGARGYTVYGTDKDTLDTADPSSLLAVVIDNHRSPVPKRSRYAVAAYNAARIEGPSAHLRAFHPFDPRLLPAWWNERPAPPTKKKR